MRQATVPRPRQGVSTWLSGHVCTAPGTAHSAPRAGVGCPGLQQQDNILEYRPVPLSSWVISTVGGPQPEDCSLPYFRERGEPAHEQRSPCCNF